ncbi:MAG: porin, partial [Pseudomonadota bacterium]
VPTEFSDDAGDALGIRYATPSISGFTAAASYHPNGSTEGANDTGYGFASRGIAGAAKDIYSLAANYSGDFGGFSLGVGADYTAADDNSAREVWSIGAEVGTAGFTSMLAVMALEDQGLKPGNGPVLVTGAAGGVGSVATAILGKLGYEVAAVTGRPETADYLKSLGATQIVAREELNEPTKRPLESENWAGCVDAVGGVMLARLLGQMKYGGSVAAVGLAGGPKLETTVIPFLLRGVNLLGIDSVMQPYENRLRAWSRITSDLPMDKLHAMVEVKGLADLPDLGPAILGGKVKGRVVIDVNA